MVLWGQTAGNIYRNAIETRSRKKNKRVKSNESSERTLKALASSRRILCCCFFTTLFLARHELLPFPYLFLILTRPEKEDKRKRKNKALLEDKEERKRPRYDSNSEAYSSFLWRSFQKRLLSRFQVPQQQGLTHIILLRSLSRVLE